MRIYSYYIRDTAFFSSREIMAQYLEYWHLSKDEYGYMLSLLEKFRKDKQ